MKTRGIVAILTLVLLAVVAGAAVFTQNQRTHTDTIATATSTTTTATQDAAVNGTMMADARLAQAPQDEEPATTGERPNLDVPYVPTPQEVLDKMLELAKITKNDVVYDLGCGDGRIVITAAKRYGVRGVGIDIDPERVKESRENAKKEGVEKQVRFSQNDLFKTNISEANVLMLYLLPNINLRLRPKIFEELKPGARIASHSFDMGDWKPDQTVTIPSGGWDRTVYFWVLPAHVAGTWQWSTPGSNQKASLQLTQKFQEISGTHNNAAITGAKIEGDRITFTVAGTTYEGRVSGNTIEGTMRDAKGQRAWQATRAAGKMPSIQGDGADMPQAEQAV